MPQVSISQEQVKSIEWDVAASLPAPEGADKQPGLAGAVSGMYNDVLIVGGGANFPDGMPWLGGKKKYHDEVYVFKAVAPGKLMSVEKKYKLPFSTAYGASCSTPAGVVYVGGESSEGISNKVVLLQWDKARQNLITKNLPDLPLAVANASATSWGSKIFVLGGETVESAINAFHLLDLDKLADGWKEMPALPRPVSHAVAAIQKTGSVTSIYLVGGRRKNAGELSEFYGSTYAFDLIANKWSEKRSLPYRLAASTGIAVGNKHLLLFGGDRGDTFNKTENLIFAIAKEKDGTKKDELNQQKIALQANHPGFSKEVLQYDTETDKWTVVGSIPFNSPVTTTAVKWGSSVIIPSGEIKAGVRTPQILVGEVER